MPVEDVLNIIQRTSVDGQYECCHNLLTATKYAEGLGQGSCCHYERCGAPSGEAPLL